MPELPEVEVLARHLGPLLRRKTIRGVVVQRKKILKPTSLKQFQKVLTGATFTGPAVNYSGTVQLERSFDGGKTWICCNLDRAGTLAQWATGTPVSQTFGEPEKNVLYRLNCITYSAGVINYRISQTGGAAESLAIGPLSNG